MSKRRDRPTRAKKLVKFYTSYTRARQLRLRRRKSHLQKASHTLRQVSAPKPSSDLSELSSLSSLSSLSDFGPGNSADNSESTDDEWSDILGSDWRNDSSGSSLSSDTSSSDGTSSSGGMPDLLPVNTGSDTDDEVEFWSSGEDADDEEEEDDADGPGLRPPLLRRWVHDEIEGMYAHRYEEPRDTLPRGPSFLHHVLGALKAGRPDHFREALRVTPLTFDKIVAKISDDPVFTNNSRNAQISIEEQLAITLYRFGHDGNAASLQGVANWAGIGKGTVHLITRRVMAAVLQPEFMQSAVRMPTPAEKEEAKAWVEAHSCKAWRDGWCFVDGTLVPLDARPFWFGESYFDRKSNYSLNIQVVNLPNLRIIDFSYGHTGSTHDATAWLDTRLVKEHDEIFEEGEWVWADSAYPIDTWVIAPFKKPERDEPNNEIFNNHVSMVRIRSEHAIGFLKGRFHSLKNLRVNIKDETSHRVATYWVAACVGLHSFAMQCEEVEREEDDDVDADPFIVEGLPSSSDEDSDNARQIPSRARPTGIRLHDAKVRRQQLKEKLFYSMEKRARRRAARRAEGFNI